MHLFYLGVRQVRRHLNSIRRLLFLQLPLPWFKVIQRRLFQQKIRVLLQIGRWQKVVSPLPRPAHKRYQLSGIVPVRSLSSTVLGLNMSLWHLNTGTTKEINTNNQSIWDTSVSPDRLILAYAWFNTHSAKWELALTDSTVNHRKVAWSSDKGFGFTGWLNSHQLIIRQVPSYTIIDSDTGSYEKISPLDYPDFAVYDQAQFYVSCNPSLTKAIYKTGNIILLDVNTKTIISQVDDRFDRTPIVSWQTSGDRVALVGTVHLEKPNGLSDEIFTTEGNWQFKQLTYLYKSFGQAFTIDSISWSPNGEKIAFWLADGSRINLMIVDTLTGSAVNYCISSNLFLFPITLPAPIWSPDGNKLLVEHRYIQDKNGPNQNKSQLLIVDLQNKIAFPIAEDESRVGWMLP